MIGLQLDGRPLLRAYSMASANYEETLEFFSIKVANGPLTSRLQHLSEGDSILVGRKPTGTLILDNLLPGKNLYLLGTGTGLAPLLSLIKDPEVYNRYERGVLVHGCRKVGELAYMDTICDHLPNDPLIGAEIAAKLTYYPTVTREPFENRGRITQLIESGKLFADIGMKPLDPERDRVMLCGSPHMLTDLQTLLTARDFSEGNHSTPGHFVVEKAFVER